MVANTGMPDEQQQRQRLLRIKEREGYGILMICKRRGDVVFAASPVPALFGCEIVSAAPDVSYDVWKDGDLVTPDLTLDEVHAWIKSNTPRWLYDDSDVAVEQKQLLSKWIDRLFARYPGVITIG